MILHGHTSETCDAIRIEDWASVVEHCGAGLMGPFTAHIVGFRLASYTRSLQATVLSAFGGRMSRDPDAARDWPELAPYMAPAEERDSLSLTASVERLAARFMPGPPAC